jgi:phage terminase large subunit
LEPAYIDGFHAQGFYIPKVKESVKDVLYIGGTYRENLPNLDTATVERYKEYQETKPSYYWQVIEGLVPEVLMGKIYSGWKVIDEVPHEARLLGYGLDFGFHPDPAAIVAIYYYNGGYILDEELYQTKLLNHHLATTIKSLPEAPVVPDSAEPKSIAELEAEGINVIPAEKGHDSVRYGIKLVQNLKISYTKRSLNLAKEYDDYSWKVTKDGDELPIPDPAKADHALDAARYGLSLLAGKTHTEYNKVAEKQVEIFIRGRNAQKQNDTR